MAAKASTVVVKANTVAVQTSTVAVNASTVAVNASTVAVNASTVAVKANTAAVSAESDLRQRTGLWADILERMHIVPGLKVLYFGTPVVLISSRNPDGSTNLAPMSSAWWLGQTAVLGLGDSAQTTANLRRERECVLNLVPSDLVAAVDRIALTTAARVVPAHKAAQGYRHEADKFAAGGLTEQPSELVAPSRVAQCPIQLEARVVAEHPIGTPQPWGTAFHVEVLRAHVEQELLVPGTHYVDPLRWDPLIMKFCEFFGGGAPVHPSRLAEGWRMPHGLRAAGEGCQLFDDSRR